MQYEEDYSDKLEWFSYMLHSDVEVQSCKWSSDKLENAEADEADQLRGGMTPKRARKGERQVAKDEYGVSVKLKFRKRSSEDGGGRVEEVWVGLVIIIRG